MLRLLLLLPLIVLNTVIHTSVLFGFALLKLLLPIAALRRALTRLLMRIAESWIGGNSLMIDWLTPTRIELDSDAELRRDGWYLVIANHQSWVDILVLQKVFNRRIPLLKFFLKQQLIWVPLLGLAWWALDFPFMRRLSPTHLQRHPEWRDRDRGATRKACQRFKQTPVSVMNFIEGTRFTPAKQARGGAGFQHLLRPKAGGIAFVLDAMGEMFEALLDVTVVYPAGIPTLLDLLSGRLPEVRVQVRQRIIPATVLGGDYAVDAAYRGRLQEWLNDLWADKDAAWQQAMVGGCGADNAPTLGNDGNSGKTGAGERLPEKR